MSHFTFFTCVYQNSQVNKRWMHLKFTFAPGAVHSAVRRPRDTQGSWECRRAMISAASPSMYRIEAEIHISGSSRLAHNNIPRHRLASNSRSVQKLGSNNKRLLALVTSSVPVYSGSSFDMPSNSRDLQAFTGNSAVCNKMSKNYQNSFQSLQQCSYSNCAM